MGGASRHDRSRGFARSDSAPGVAAAGDAKTNERDPDYGVTVVGLFFYVVVVAGVLVLLDIE